MRFTEPKTHLMPLTMDMPAGFFAMPPPAPASAPPQFDAMSKSSASVRDGMRPTALVAQALSEWFAAPDL